MTYLISDALLNIILKNLQRQPYAEVAAIITEIGKCEPNDNNNIKHNNKDGRKLEVPGQSGTPGQD